MIKVALVGTGGMGTVHYHNYAHIDGCEVTALVDVTESREKQPVGLPLYRISRHGSRPAGGCGRRLHAHLPAQAACHASPSLGFTPSPKTHCPAQKMRLRWSP